MTSSTQATETIAPPKSAPRRLYHIRELDGARGLAALMVFFHHVAFSTIEGGRWGHGLHFLQTAAAYGNTAVDLFFSLSGFLITSILLESRHRPAYYSDFYWKRVLRILPLYTLILLGVLIVSPAEWRGVLLSAVFLVNFGAMFHINMFGPFWSLAIEEQFYLIWPTVVRRRSVGQLARWAAMIAISVIVFRFISGLYNHHNYFHTFYRCDGLAYGALIACWFETRRSSPSARRLENIVLNASLLAGLALCTAATWYISAAAHPGNFASVFQTGVAITAAGITGRLIRDSGARYLAIFRTPLLTFFGLISYAFYMLHLYVLEAWDHVRGLPAPGDDAAFLIRLISVLALSTAAALASRYLVELPALSLRKRVLKAPSPPPVSAESLNSI